MQSIGKRCKMENLPVLGSVILYATLMASHTIISVPCVRRFCKYFSPLAVSERVPSSSYLWLAISHLLKAPSWKITVFVVSQISSLSLISCKEQWALVMAVNQCLIPSLVSLIILWPASAIVIDSVSLEHIMPESCGEFTKIIWNSWPA